jgi:hypothetical protein
MRFMILLKADKTTEAGVLPSEAQLAEMGKYNEELMNAGVLLAGEGLQPSSKGARVRFSGDARTVFDGPFLLDDRREVQGRGHRVGQTLSQSSGRRGGDRDPPGVRGGGFRRRVHARAQGGGRTHARTGS